MIHRHTDARSDGVELELAALRGRVAMVEAELVALRATRYVSSLGSRGAYQRRGQRPAQLAFLRRREHGDTVP
jgi:hypothetical protein